MLIPMNLLNREILDALEQRVLHPAIVTRALDKAMQELQIGLNDGNPDTRRKEFQKELLHIETELARLTTAIAIGGTLATLLAAVQEREERRLLVIAKLAELDGWSAVPFDAGRVEEELRSYL